MGSIYGIHTDPMGMIMLLIGLDTEECNPYTDHWHLYSEHEELSRMEIQPASTAEHVAEILTSFHVVRPNNRAMDHILPW